MRDFVIIVGLFGFLPMSFMRPYLGVLLWTWISVMSPHRMAYGFVYSLPINKIVVLATAIALVLSPERKKLPGGNTMIAMLLFFVWTTIATIMAHWPTHSLEFYFSHIFTMMVHIIVAMMVINSKVRLHALLWILAISLGWHGFKIGLVTIANGGSIGGTGFRDYGPPDTMVADRNHMALAFLITASIIFYLYQYSAKRFVRIACMGVFCLQLIAVVGSQSRGAFVALIAMAGYMWLKTNRKFFTACIGGVVLFVGIIIAPPQIKERVGSLFSQITSSEDPFQSVDQAFGSSENSGKSLSLQTRFSAWRMAFNMAKERPFVGQGPRAVQHDLTSTIYYDRDDPLYGTIFYRSRAAHSIYFELMSDSGFVGLFLYVLMAFLAWYNLQKIRWKTVKDLNFRWMYDLSGYLQLSIVGFMVGGAALSMTYYDGFFLIIVCAITVQRLYLEETGEKNPRRFYDPLKAMKERRKAKLEGRQTFKNTRMS